MKSKYRIVPDFVCSKGVVFYKIERRYYGFLWLRFSLYSLDLIDAEKAVKLLNSFNE